MTVEQILKRKAVPIPSLNPRLFISDVIAELEAHDVGAFIVSGDKKTIDGVISERDIIRGLERYGEEILDQRIRDVMNKHVITCTKHAPVAGVMAQMYDKNIRHIPVVDENNFVGMISMKDIIKLRLDEVQMEADAMREYISGDRTD